MTETVDSAGERISRAVAALPEPAQSVFRLHAADGLDFPAIGARLGIGPFEVERLLAEAIVEIGRFLGAMPDG